MCRLLLLWILVLLYVWLLNTDPQPHTHSHHFPSSLQVRDITVLAGSIVWATRRGEKPTVPLGETFQLETEKGESRNRHLPGQPRRPKKTASRISCDRAKCVLSGKGESQSYRA